MTLRQPSEIPYAGDVGSSSFEEIDAVPRGANLGWPCYEGHVRHALYAGTPVCESLYGKGKTAVRWPSLTLGRKDAASVTGGVFYTGSRFPAAFRGVYIFGDWERNWLRFARLGRTIRAEGRLAPLAEPAAGPVKLFVDANGDLMYLALNAGELRLIRYAGR